jgi:hypothetical protein
VHRAIGEQGEDGGADITATRPATAAATAAGTTEATHAHVLLPISTTWMTRMSV